ncbi:site-2 protease family protein [Candidatus Woesearchaeota archaeon]|nr:site-2 protease family protein [Candidatus Woesearchaeota archaeon]
MAMDVIDILLRYKFILLFYLAIVIFLLWKRKKIDVQGKIILLYRTRWGLAWMDRVSQKWREWIVLLGYIGVGAGYVGLLLISGVLLKNLYDLLTKPETVSGVSLVLPGINVPGMGVLPFWYWIVALFFIAIVHEFAHGVVARAHNIEVRNTGFVFLGPIIGAFVEPNEKKLTGEKDIVQYAVLAAGAFSNILLAILAVLLLNIVFMPIQQTMVEPAGFSFASYYSDSLPFAQAGIPVGTSITGINSLPTANFETFADQLQCLKPGQSVEVETKERKYSLLLAASPDQPGKPFLGIKEIKNEFELKEKYKSGGWKTIYYLLDWWNGFLRWLFLLSFGIGLFNLLPLPVVDGGRMMQVTLHKMKGKEVGEKRYRQISLFFLLLLLLNLFFPLLSKLF